MQILEFLVFFIFFGFGGIVFIGTIQECGADDSNLKVRFIGGAVISLVCTIGLMFLISKGVI